MPRLTGKVAIVTGAARGLGRAFAEALVADGAAVVIGDVLEDDGREAAAQLGPRCSYVRLDVTRRADWSGALAAANAFGPVNVLVNNAGIRVVHGLADLSEDDYRRVIEVNQLGPVLGMQAVLGDMKASGGGSIVNISSVLGISAMPGRISYVASKWAVRGMTKAAAIELGPFGIRVNSVHPGIFPTALTEGADIDTYGNVPLGRFGELRELAQLVVHLCSDESSYTTGAEHIVDGGLTAGMD